MSEQPARIGLLSDVHARSEDEEEVLTELRWVVDRFDGEFGPDHVFVLGDLVEDEDAATDREHVRAVREAVESGEFPVTYLLGNHDVENLTRDELRDLLDQEAFHGRVEIAGQEVVYLDSSAPRLRGPRGELGDEQLAFLEEILPDLSDALALVHHPVGFVDLADNDWFAEFPERAFLGDRKDLLRTVEETGGLRATVNGHIHETHAVRFWDLDHVSMNAFNKEYPGADVTGTYAELTVGETVEVEIREREEVVRTVTFG